MSTDPLMEKLIAAIRAVKQLPADIQPHQALVADLGLASIDMVDLFFEIEQSTGQVVELNRLVANLSGEKRFSQVTVADLHRHLGG